MAANYNAYPVPTAAAVNTNQYTTPAQQNQIPSAYANVQPAYTNASAPYPQATYDSSTPYAQTQAFANQPPAVNSYAKVPEAQAYIASNPAFDASSGAQFSTQAPTAVPVEVPCLNNNIQQVSGPPATNAEKVSYEKGEDGSKPLDCIVVKPPPSMKTDAELQNEIKQQLAQVPSANLNGDFQVEVPTATPVIGTDDFFTQQEMNVLNQIPTAQPVQVQASQKVDNTPTGNPAYALSPNNGLPVISNAYSQAKVSSDWLHSGIKTRDKSVGESKEEIFKFLNMHNTPPRVYIEIEGYRYETRLVTRTRTENGQTRTYTETVRERRTDFRYGVDISHFVYPYGKIVNRSSKYSAEEYVENFVNTKNKLKALQMKKHIIGFDFRFLQQQIRGYLRMLGYIHYIDVHTRIRNKSVRVVTPSKLAKFWDNPAGRVASWITIIPGIVMTAYGSKHRKHQLASHFVMQYSPYQIFAAIRPQLWVTTPYAGCSIM